MSPIDEFDLRHELRSARPDAPLHVPDPAALGALVAERGRRTRRTRRVVAGVAAASGSASPSVRPGGSTTAGSGSSGRPTAGTATPASTTTPTRAPWTDTKALPAQYGDLRGIRLKGDTQGGFVARKQTLQFCAAYSFSYEGLRGLEAGRSVETAEPMEGGTSDAVLVFATEAQASRFIRDVGSSMQSCVEAPQKDTAAEGDIRTNFALSESPTGGTYGLTFTSYTEEFTSGAWRIIPSAGAERWVQKGRVVARSGDGGEIPYDPATMPEYLADLQSRVDYVLAQTCKLDGAC